MSDVTTVTVRGLYETLLDFLGPTHWWPADCRFEIAVGAILTQNTAWNNVERALGRLKTSNALHPHAIVDLPADKLAELIRSAGYCRTKAGYLQSFCTWLLQVCEDQDCLDDDRLRRCVDDRTDDELRAELLSIRGIGGETSDDLMLYVFDRPAFIADRYARRMFETLGVHDLKSSYEGFRARVQPHVASWPVEDLKEFHGLIDEFGKTCRSETDWQESALSRYRLTFERLEHVEHGFGPVWDSGSRVLVLGSMPSPKSRQMRFYYGHPQNRFWPVMAAVFDDDSCLNPNGAMSADALVEMRRRFALRHHIALWDVIASCDIVGASDASIRNVVPNDIASIVAHSNITHVFTTGVKAGQLYRKLCMPALTAAGFSELPMDVLPSTSPANAAMRLDSLVDAYRCVADCAILSQ